MKTEPTDLDREAARLFTPAPGMRASMADAGFCGEWVIICDVEPGLWAGERGKVCGWRRGSPTRFGDAWEAFGPCAEILAIDVDDNATVGVMVAQVRAAGRPAFSTRSVLNGDGVRIWRSDGADGWYETEGASVVAEMRALKGKP